MSNKETKLRLTPSLDEWLTSQAAIAGIAKTKYITQVLEDLKATTLYSDTSDLEDEIVALKARLTKLEQTI